MTEREPTQAWPAPTAAGPVSARIAVPGSKSHTNRALVLAALADGPSRIVGGLQARDTALMSAALTTLGARIVHRGEETVVTPGPGRGGTIDAGLAGTVMRFVPPLATLATGATTFDGDPEARRRPMAPLLDALRQVGAHIDDGGRAALPFVVHGTGGLPGGSIGIDSSGSSQFLSALLLTGARWDRGVEIRHTGARPVPSLPHVRMTLAALAERGVAVDASQTDVWHVAPGPIAGYDETIEPDLSNAAPFLAAALITGGTVTIPYWPRVTTQPGDRLRAILAAFGADVHRSADGLTVVGAGSVAGVDLDLGDVSELTPVIAVLAAVADGPSTLRGVAHVRGHETDRLAALATDLVALGADVTETDDGLHIRPRPLHGGLWGAFADHRMAQAGAVLGLVVPGIVIDDIASTTKTLADFPGMWAALLQDAVTTG